MLENESLLQVLHFADYKTLVLAKLAEERFLRLATRFGEELARRRSFQVTFFKTCIDYIDVTAGAKEKSIGYERGNQSSLAAACQELAGAIGAHSVAAAMFSDDMWNVPGVCCIFEYAPPLKYAVDVGFAGPLDSTTAKRCEAFMRKFDGTKSFIIWRIKYDAFRQFGWAFLGHKSARELRLIKVSVKPLAPSKSMDRSVEKLVRICAALPRLLGGKPLELDFTENLFSAAFGQRIIELLKKSGRKLTFRMLLSDGDDLPLDESEYTVDVDDTMKRYVSRESGIEVAVNGRWIEIRSTVGAPPTKQSNGTSSLCRML